MTLDNIIEDQESLFESLDHQGRQEYVIAGFYRYLGLNNDEIPIRFRSHIPKSLANNTEYASFLKNKCQEIGFKYIPDELNKYLNNL